MSGRVTVLTTLFGVVLIGGVVLLPGLAAAQSSGLDNCLYESGDVAIAACSAAIKANPHDAEAYEGRGSAYVRKGDNERALADYSEAIRQSPDYALPYFNRGLVLENKNQLQQALSDFKRAADLDPSDDDSKKAVARVTASLKTGSVPTNLVPVPATVVSVPASASVSVNSGPFPASSSAPPTRSGSAVPSRSGSVAANSGVVSATGNSVPARGGSGSVATRNLPPPPATSGSAPARSAAVPANSGGYVTASVPPSSSLPPSADDVSPSSEAVAAVSEPAPVTSGSAPADSQSWSTTGATISKWLSDLRTPKPATATASVSGSGLLKPTPSKVLSNDSIMETQEYWNDEMALANGGASNTRRIIALERLGELQSSGILTKQEFEQEKRRILGE
jgi:tetratricopeptide (TPR) repeat protein